MIKAFSSLYFRVLTLAGLAVVAAILANALASPSRKLDWRSAQPALPAITPPAATPLAPAVQPQAPPLPEPQPSGLPRAVAPRSHPAPPAEPQVQAAFSPIREITSQEAWESFKAGLPFLDARRSADFAENHIAGAWSTPVWESDVDDRLFAFKIARRPGSEDPIVIYCSGGDCRDSHLLAAKLLKDGYFHLLIYRDGFPDWVAQHRPTDKGRP